MTAFLLALVGGSFRRVVLTILGFDLGREGGGSFLAVFRYSWCGYAWVGWMLVAFTANIPSCHPAITGP